MALVHACDRVCRALPSFAARKARTASPPQVTAPSGYPMLRRVTLALMQRAWVEACEGSEQATDVQKVGVWGGGHGRKLWGPDGRQSLLKSRFWRLGSDQTEEDALQRVSTGAEMSTGG